MKTFSLLATFICFVFVGAYAQYDWQWAISEGGINNETVLSLCSDDSGNLYATGSFRDTVDFFGQEIGSAGYTDVFVASFDPDGNLNWVMTGGGTYEDTGWDIATDNAFVYVTGSFTRTATFKDSVLNSVGSASNTDDMDMFLIKLDMEGNIVWSVTGGSTSDDAAKSLALGNDGTIYVTGDMNYEAVFGDHVTEFKGVTDIFLAAWNQSGTNLWATSAGGTNYDYGRAVKVLPNGDVVMSGRYAGTATFGDSTITAIDAADAFIAIYNNVGVFKQLVSLSGGGNEDIQGMDIDSEGNIYVGGWFMTNLTIGSNTLFSWGEYDVFLARFSSALEPNWSVKYGASGSDEPRTVHCDTDDNILLAGTFERKVNFGELEYTSQGYADGFVLLLNSAGNILWGLQSGGTGGQRINGSCSDLNGNYFVGGDFVDELKIGNNTLGPAAAYDLFMAKIAEDNVGINEASLAGSNSWQIYPHPVSSTAIVNISGMSGKLVCFELYDLKGKLIFTKNLTESVQTSFALNISELENGIYIGVVKDSDQQHYYRKIIKQ
ncbi:T9SS type A sorting domain-containing protein [Saccharicrinis sp. FJH2]|uniref:T9SS type A sorting domain-containing protein n=1 Tax=Saccharicrinis sp. FJH65 TaxID=3344659 RepID=UPI0035F31826